MDTLRFSAIYFKLTLGRLCRQRRLLAGLVLLCFLLPFGAGRAAEVLLSRGVDFHGVTLAVTAPEGDSVPQQLEQYMGNMEDLAQYCRIVSMGENEALAALEGGEVTAVLELPENFIRGVMWGTNPDLRLIVPADRPLESLLLLWVGQSACDILSAFQSGVYAVLDLYEENQPPGLTREDVVFDINLRYISLALNRTDMFQTREISATRGLPVPLHYALALITCFALSAAPLFVPVYSADWLRPQRRLRAAGRRIFRRGGRVRGRPAPAAAPRPGAGQRRDLPAPHRGGAGHGPVLFAILLGVLSALPKRRRMRRAGLHRLSAVAGPGRGDRPPGAAARPGAAAERTVPGDLAAAAGRRGPGV